MQIQLPKQASPTEIDVPCGCDQLHSVEDSSINISSNEGFSSVPTAITSEESAHTQLEQSTSECCDIRSDRSEHSDFSFIQDMASSVASHSAAPSQTTTEFWDEEKESLVSEPSEPNGQLSPRSGTSFGQLHGLGRTVIGAAVDSSVSLASRFLPIPSRFLPSVSPRSEETTHEDVPPPFTLQMNSVDLSAFSVGEPLENETNDGFTATLAGDEPSSQLDEFLQRIRSTEEMIRGRVQILRSHESDEEKSTPLEMDPRWLHDDRDTLRAEIRGLISQSLDITHIFPNFSGRLRQLNFTDDDEGMLSSLVDRSVAVFEHVSHELFPFFQEFVVETWDFFRDVLEYYDPNPKYNVFLRTIDKVNEIFAAIQSLYSLSECYFNELDSLEGLEIDYVSSVPPLPMLEPPQPSQQEQDGELQNDTETMNSEEFVKEEEGTTDERENESISCQYGKDHNNDKQHTDEHHNAILNTDVSVGT